MLDSPRSERESLDELDAGKRATLATSLLDGRRTLSLDIFDTALGRQVGCPSDLFLFVAGSYRARQARSPFDFARERIAAERRCRRAAVAAGRSEEVTLAEIYRALELPSDWSADDLQALELDCELHLTIANADVRALYEEARRRAMPVVFVSDTYLPSEFLRQLLQAHGYVADRIFVSCEARQNKSSGGIWPIVFAELGGDASAIIHIGDDHEGDVRRPRAAGLSAHAYRPTPKSEHRSANASLQAALIRRRMTIGRDDFWSRVGYAVAGPFYLGYVAWVLEQASRDHIERIYFCSRDGHIWRRVYELMTASDESALPSEYLYASRRAFYIPGLTQIDDEAIDYLCIGLAELRVCDYLSRCGLAVDEPAIIAVGFPSSQWVVRTNEDRRRLRTLLRSLDARILERATEERARLLAYLRQARLLACTRAAIVDIGWHGNVQLGLARTIKAADERVQLFGYYVGTFGLASRLRAFGPPAKGWLCTEGKPAVNERLIRTCIEIFEFLHIAPHPSVISFERDGDTVRPLFGPDDADGLKHAAAARVQQAGLEYVKDHLAARRAFQWLRPDGPEAWEPLRRLIEEPDVEAAAHLGELNHADGFGPAFHAKPIARPTVKARPFHLHSLYRDYQAAFWKEGYIARQFGGRPHVRKVMRGIRNIRVIPHWLRRRQIKLSRLPPSEYYFAFKDSIYNALRTRVPRLLTYSRKLAPLLRRLEQRHRKSEPR